MSSGRQKTIVFSRQSTREERFGQRNNSENQQSPHKIQKEKKNVPSKYEIIANLCSYITLRENKLKSESTTAESRLKMMKDSIF